MINKKSVEPSETPEDYWCRLISKSGIADSAFATKDKFIIGRAPTSDLQIKNGRISGLHCTLSKEKQENESETKFFIEDNSSNGTFVNDKKLEKGIKFPLKNGDQIILLKDNKGLFTINIRLYWFYLYIK